MCVLSLKYRLTYHLTEPQKENKTNTRCKNKILQNEKVTRAKSWYRKVTWCRPTGKWATCVIAGQNCCTSRSQEFYSTRYCTVSQKLTVDFVSFLPYLTGLCRRNSSLVRLFVRRQRKYAVIPPNGKGKQLCHY